MNEVSPFVLRQAARDAVAEIYERGLFGADRPSPRGTLRGIDVLPPSVVQQKLNRTAKIFYNQRGRIPNLAAPSLYFEKLALSRFFAPVPMPSPADKLGVADFITPELRGTVSTIEVLWSGHEPINRDLVERLGLPRGSYFAKSSGGTGRNIRFTVPLDEEVGAKLELRSTGWLSELHGERAGEWWYGLMKARNLIERDAAPDGTSLTDWKFHVGGGEILAVQVDRDRQADHVQTMYSRDFDHIPEEMFFRFGSPEAEPPFFQRMCDVARSIAKPFEFARVDLYHADGKIYLGEITLAPMGGHRPPRSTALDELLGRAWTKGLFGTESLLEPEGT